MGRLGIKGGRREGGGGSQGLGSRQEDREAGGWLAGKEVAVKPREARPGVEGEERGGAETG